MSIKLIHAADFHLDSPFDSLPENKALSRRREQRALLDSIADLAEAEKADIVLLAGDLLDSSVCYHETCETLLRVLSRISAQIFIAPGNHDYYCDKSPYSFLPFPENVHIFSSPIIRYVDLPELGCRVYGAGFNSPASRPLLPGFAAQDSGLLNIMVLHGDTSGDRYNYISENDIRNSNLDYLALGHVHSFSGIRSAAGTFYAYPGCPEGRGFDETGEKGVIAGTISKDSADLRFVPLGGRQYRVVRADVSVSPDPASAAASALTSDMAGDIVRLVLCGTYDGRIDCGRIASALAEKAYHLTVRDETRAARDIWEGLSEDTLRGGFLRIMHKKYAEADDAGKKQLLMAVRCGLAALENGEEWES